MAGTMLSGKDFAKFTVVVVIATTYLCSCDPVKDGEDKLINGESVPADSRFFLGDEGQADERFFFGLFRTTKKHHYGYGHSNHGSSHGNQHYGKQPQNNYGHSGKGKGNYHSNTKGSGHSYGNNKGSYGGGGFRGGFYGKGSGSSHGKGSGSSYGKGSGSSYGKGSGSSYGKGSGSSYGKGSGSSYGKGSGNSYGEGLGDSYGKGSENSYGKGSGNSYGKGSGSSYGKGSGSSYGKGSESSYGKGSGNSYDKGSGNSYKGGFRGNSHGGYQNSGYRGGSKGKGHSKGSNGHFSGSFRVNSYRNPYRDNKGSASSHGGGTSINVGSGSYQNNNSGRYRGRRPNYANGSRRPCGNRCPVSMFWRPANQQGFRPQQQSSTGQHTQPSQNVLKQSQLSISNSQGTGDVSSGGAQVFGNRLNISGQQSQPTQLSNVFPTNRPQIFGLKQNAPSNRPLTFASQGQTVDSQQGNLHTFGNTFTGIQSGSTYIRPYIRPQNQISQAFGQRPNQLQNFGDQSNRPQSIGNGVVRPTRPQTFGSTFYAQQIMTSNTKPNPASSSSVNVQPGKLNFGNQFPQSQRPLNNAQNPNVFQSNFIFDSAVGSSQNSLSKENEAIDLNVNQPQFIRVPQDTNSFFGATRPPPTNPPQSFIRIPEKPQPFRRPISGDLDQSSSSQNGHVTPDQQWSFQLWSQLNSQSQQTTSDLTADNTNRKNESAEYAVSYVHPHRPVVLSSNQIKESGSGFSSQGLKAAFFPGAITTSSVNTATTTHKPFYSFGNVSTAPQVSTNNHSSKTNEASVGRKPSLQTVNQPSFVSVTAVKPNPKNFHFPFGGSFVAPSPKRVGATPIQSIGTGFTVQDDNFARSSSANSGYTLTNSGTYVWNSGKRVATADRIDQVILDSPKLLPKNETVEEFFINELSKSRKENKTSN